MNRMLFSLGLLTTLAAVTLGSKNQSADCSAFQGVWRYDLEGREGLIVVSGDYGAGILTATDRPTLAQQPTDSALAQAYRTASAWAAHFRCDGSRIDNETLHDLNPNNVGLTIVTENQLVGNEIRWWTVSPDGTRGPTLTATRIQ